MNARSKQYTPLYLAILLAVGILIGRYWDRIRINRPFYDQTLMEQVIDLVEKQYVDTLESSEVEIRAINQLLHSFDPHSVYIPASDVAGANQDLKGSFVGVGVEFVMHNDTPFVTRIIEGGPAEAAGIHTGDRILQADTTVLLGMKSNEIVKYIKGKRDSEVELQIWHEHIDSLRKVKVKRGTVELRTVFATEMDDSTLYVRIAHFADPTMDEFREAMEQNDRDQRMRRVIMDLRDNPGGYLKVAVELLDEFVSSTDLLAYTKGKGDNQKSYHATEGGSCSDKQLICLVNGYSASASEIFSGAVQDLDRGLIIGERTFGKGLVQETFHLKDGSQIRLTVARYYIPSGRSIQKPYSSSGYKDYHEAESGTDSFQTALGRIVFAEGGVKPDVEWQTEVLPDREDIMTYLIKLSDRYGNVISGLPDVEAYWNSAEIDIALQTMLDRDSSSVNADMIKYELAYQLYSNKALEFVPAVNDQLREVSTYFGKMEVLLNTKRPLE